MELDKNPVINNAIWKLSTGLSMLLVIFTLVIFVVTYIKTLSAPLMLTVATLAVTQTTTYLELNHCADLMVYFAIRVRFINCIIANHSEDIGRHYEKNDIPVITKKFMKALAAQTHDFRHKDVDVYLGELFKSFEKFRDLYQFQMFLFCSKILIECAIYFQVIAVGIQLHVLQFFDVLSIASFSIANFIIAFATCMRCQLFAREIRDTKQLCISVMSVYTDGPLRAKAKRMLSMVEAVRPCFSVYGMWTVEAGLLLKLFSIITSMMVTELQFILL